MTRTQNMKLQKGVDFKLANRTIDFPRKDSTSAATAQFSKFS